MKSAEDIIEKLKKSFHTPSRKDEKVKVVVVCIVISTTFWFFSALNKEDYISQINYPIEIEFDQEAYIATRDLPTRIPIEVTGGGWDLMTRSFGFNMNPITVSLDRPDESDHVMTASLRGQLTPRLDPVVINYILRDSIKFDIQKKVSRTFRLALDPSSISLDDSHRISSPISIQPDTVVWTGPERIIRDLDRVIYLEANLTEIDRDVSEEIDIPTTPEFVVPQLESALLSFEVVRMLDISDNVLISLLNFPDSTWQSSDAFAAIRYKIAETYFDAIDTARVGIVADFNDMNPVDSSIVLKVGMRDEHVEELEIVSSTIRVIKND
ncbi:hypothetical protein [Roseivirga sp. E12]|uniref:hypothetical protein n=1 Tax=Roseivirga sp. E12 TaxID=2819237 RepID=UPI001ABCB367|nr:hypothetical protein [Roseivirga sp. E12]MBO3700372.1 hypothetical protein [Roseivirga sp. E12]